MTARVHFRANRPASGPPPSTSSLTADIRSLFNSSYRSSSPSSSCSSPTESIDSCNEWQDHVSPLLKSSASSALPSSPNKPQDRVFVPDETASLLHYDTHMPVVLRPLSVPNMPFLPERCDGPQDRCHVTIDSTGCSHVLIRCYLPRFVSTHVSSGFTPDGRLRIVADRWSDAVGCRAFPAKPASSSSSEEDVNSHWGSGSSALPSNDCSSIRFERIIDLSPQYHSSRATAWADWSSDDIYTIHLQKKTSSNRRWLLSEPPRRNSSQGPW